ncbi:MAG: O-antigen ligase family protein [Bacteroidales bacterium]|nr:O-antigen ligase family protein [Bacteroidales bacterium]MCF8350830.1 O-antigen ligase family protein [Bacteroidales bacterium]MCF8375381.1 O-antigen ligase family protein [Bacteroidales bacterium]MCF8401280.1 O-antigen ligase family protein [Bacteroidales bacterium]
MTEKYKIGWIYGLSVLFLALNIYLITKDIYWGLLTPVVLLIILLYVTSLDKIVYLITFLTPLAVNIQDFEFGVGISLPTEPLMFGVLIVFILKLLHSSNYDRRIFRHPVSLAIMFQLLWMFITSLTSEIPLVSFKYLLSRLWFVVPFYFVAIMLFKKKRNIKLFDWLYATPLLIIIFYTISGHVGYGFDQESAHWVMRPFYNDHTAYGAVLAMFIPVFFGFIFNKKFSSTARFLSFVYFAILVLAIILSYSRAAWISVAAALVIYLFVLLKIKFKWILITLVTLSAIFFTFQYEIMDRLEQNKQDSSADFVEHVRSIYNISSDASNLERINRWQSALRMFEERPFFGWGPGTYQFVYAPYQRSLEKTVISTNAGDMGNAHSEYIGPLSEMGMIGMLAVLAIVVTVVYTGLRVYKYSRDQEVKLISIVTLLGLITYFTHGLLNNFLDTDKLSVPFWGFIAILVALDLYKNPNPLMGSGAADTGEESAEKES